MSHKIECVNHDVSCPVRGTWIEIDIAYLHIQTIPVVPRKGHVD